MPRRAGTILPLVLTFMALRIERRHGNRSGEVCAESRQKEEIALGLPIEMDSLLRGQVSP